MKPAAFLGAVALLLSACTAGPLRLAGIYASGLTVVEVSAKDSWELRFPGPHSSETDTTKVRALVVDLAPADTLMSLNYRIMSEHMLEDASFAMVGGRFCHGTAPVGLRDGPFGAMMSARVGDIDLDYMKRSFARIKRENYGLPLRTFIAFHLFDTAPVARPGRPTMDFDVTAWRADKPDICLRVFYFYYSDGGIPPELEDHVGMQSDIIVIPAADIERALATPPVPWIPAKFIRD